MQRRDEIGESLPVPSIHPLNDFISSERYIDSLEKRLKKIKGREKESTTSKEMLSALETAKNTQMAQILGENISSTICSDTIDYSDAVMNKKHASSQNNKEEVVAIIFQDQLNQQHLENQLDQKM